MTSYVYMCVGVGAGQLNSILTREVLEFNPNFKCNSQVPSLPQPGLWGRKGSRIWLHSLDPDPESSSPIARRPRGRGTALSPGAGVHGLLSDQQAAAPDRRPPPRRKPPPPALHPPTVSPRVSPLRKSQ